MDEVMKMKFTVNVEDFWLDEEELTGALQSHIKSAVVRQISDSIKDQVEREITKQVTETMKEKTSLVIDSTISDFIATGTLIDGKREVALKDHLRGLFDRHHGWNSPDEKMKAIAKKFGDELKLQYNNAFANKIVQNMKQQGLLKDEVVQILLGEK